MYKCKIKIFPPVGDILYLSIEVPQDRDEEEYIDEWLETNLKGHAYDEWDFV